MDKSNKAPTETKRLALKREAVLQLKTNVKAGKRQPNTYAFEGWTY